MNNDNNKCDKYETFFVFRDEESFLNHLKECEDCRIEHEKYEKVSQLVKEVAPVYKEYRKIKSILVMKRIAACFLLFFGLSAITGYKAYDNYVLSQYDLSVDYSYSENDGLPTDDYGFIDI